MNSEATQDGATSSPLGEPTVNINDVFSLRRPRDARAGFSSGLKSIAKGVLGGAVGLLAAPIAGAHRDGVAGFAKGLASGVVGAIVLPVTGVGIGTVQFVRGVINTPEAVVQTNKGKLWDETRREWVDPDMIVPLEVKTKPGTRVSGRGGLSRPEGGEDYYAILQVPHEASGDQIKKQYYLLARKYHPDKNPGDAGAHERFQKLGQAYQVLGNEELRTRYDAGGSEGLSVNFMDSSLFFNTLFGSDLFDHLVGEFLITTAARCAGELDSGEMIREQGIRVQRLCVSLKSMTKRYEEGEEAFMAAMREEASLLARASFGEVMLHTIGKVYDTQADIATGGFFGGMAAKFRAQGDSMRSQFQAASAAIKVYQAQKKIEAWEKEHERKVATAAAAAAAEVVAAGATAATTTTTEGPAADIANTTGTATNAAADAATATSTSSGACAGTKNTSDVPSTSNGCPDAAPSSTGAEAQRPCGNGMDAMIERHKLEEAALPLMLEAMWAANALDIQNTLGKVCKFVLTEEGVPRAELQQRANALKLLGGIFMEAKAPDSTVQMDVRKQMEEAMMRAVEKQAGYEEGGERTPTTTTTTTTKAADE